jgi:hypothetical protein
MAHELEIIPTVCLKKRAKKRWEMTAAEREAHVQAKEEEVQLRGGGKDGMKLQQAAMKLIQTVVNTSVGRGAEVRTALEGLLGAAAEDDVAQILQKMLLQKDSSVCSRCLPMLVDLFRSMPAAAVVPLLTDILTGESIGTLLPKAMAEMNNRPPHMKQRFMQALGGSLTFSDQVQLLPLCTSQLSCEDVPALAVCFEATAGAALRELVLALMQHLDLEQQDNLLTEILGLEVLQNMPDSRQVLLLSQWLENLRQTNLKEVFAPENISEAQRILIALEVVGASEAILKAIQAQHSLVEKHEQVTSCARCEGDADKAKQEVAAQEESVLAKRGLPPLWGVVKQRWHEAAVSIQSIERKRQARRSASKKRRKRGTKKVAGGYARIPEANEAVGEEYTPEKLGAEAAPGSVAKAATTSGDRGDDADEESTENTVTNTASHDSLVPAEAHDEETEGVEEYLVEKGGAARETEKRTSGMATVTAVAKFKRKRGRSTTLGGKRLSKAAAKRKPPKATLVDIGDEAVAGANNVQAAWIVPEYWTKFLKTSSIKATSTNAREISLSKLRASVLQYYFEKAIADENAKRDNNPVPSMIRFVTESML